MARVVTYLMTFVDEKRERAALIAAREVFDLQGE